MNSVFHYFTVKTLCYYADLPPSRAQDIAFYSQLVDDFNYTEFQPGSCFLVTGRPAQFFIDNNLAQLYNAVEDTWWFYPATTAISNLQSGASLLTKSHQLFTLIPFHFIPPTPVSQITNGQEGWRCKVADKAENREPILIEQILDEFFKKKERTDMELGMLLHIYADTYSHHFFSGRHSNENDVVITEIINIGKNPNESIQPSYKWTWYPTIGHARAEHIPDVCSFKFSADFKNFNGKETYTYSRNNTDSFLNCAYNIWEMLNLYNGQIGIDPTQFTFIAEKIKRAFNQCVDGTSEIMDVDKLVKIWSREFDEIEYNYKWDKMWGLKERTDLTIHPTFRGIYDADDNFFRFNVLAYRHIGRVLGKYREDVL